MLSKAALTVTTCTRHLHLLELSYYHFRFALFSSLAFSLSSLYSGSHKAIPRIGQRPLYIFLVAVACQRDHIRRVIVTLKGTRNLTLCLKVEGPYITLFDALTAYGAAFFRLAGRRAIFRLPQPYYQAVSAKAVAT